MSLFFLLMLAALICFVLSAFGVASRVNLTSIGLACMAGAFLVGGGVIGDIG